MATLMDPMPPLDPTQEVFMWAKDTTLAQASMGVVGGYPMGVILSLFSSMISAETSTQAMGTKDFFRHSLKSAHRLGYNFAYFGFLFGGIEVALEKRRGRKDMWNPTASGAVLGAAYGWRMMKVPGLVGGTIGGGALSIVFEYLMNAMGFAQH